MVRDFGNVYCDTDVTFEYQLKPIIELLKFEDVDFATLTYLPFQAQIEYTALDGSRQVRVITQRLEISTDREFLEEEANYEILGMNAIQKSNMMARGGDYKMAQVVSKAWDNKMAANHYKMKDYQREQMEDYRRNMQPTYGMMYAKQ